ncbi:hypothetical protein HPB48_007557 [Haemaphysalis longicornis]|uniref:Cytochrome P450 n=1 Tax=Haemaphysalis longicornis TaxID=44386 RepID=A0A9J6F6Y5_HAELO|nr:hypothetical protein HPB48_007557 [Haemaphysalis longicornis]
MCFLSTWQIDKHLTRCIHQRGDTIGEQENVPTKCSFTTELRVCGGLRRVITVAEEQGLLFATVQGTGDIWRFKRRLFTPAFHFRVLENYMGHFNENGNVLIKILEKHVDEKPDEALATFPLMQHLTLDIIGSKRHAPLAARVC